MKRILLSATLLLSIVGGLRAQTAPDAPELTKLLHEFLAGASKNDVAMHDRFWADDLIYTSALGRRKGKADIMRELREEAPAKPSGETVAYTAEEIRIQQYGDMAIVAFRLVATTDKAGVKTVANYPTTARSERNCMSDNRLAAGGAKAPAHRLLHRRGGTSFCSSHSSVSVASQLGTCGSSSLRVGKAQGDASGAGTERVRSIPDADNRL